MSAVLTIVAPSQIERLADWIEFEDALADGFCKANFAHGSPVYNKGVEIADNLLDRARKAFNLDERQFIHQAVDIEVFETARATIKYRRALRLARARFAKERAETIADQRAMETAFADMVSA
jgi:hypothetical protein